MNENLVKQEQTNEFGYTTEQVKTLIQNKIIPEEADAYQIKYFFEVCKRKRLDPFLKQICMIARRSKNAKGEWELSFTIQATLDGMRAIAQRNVKIISYKRWTEKKDGEIFGICEISTSNRGLYYDELPFSEYVQKTKEGETTKFWKQFPHTMIKKCAEESVLRMLAPEDLSGVYGDDEMQQADKELPEVQKFETPVKFPELDKPKQEQSLGSIIDAEFDSMEEPPEWVKAEPPEEPMKPEAKPIEVLANESGDEEKRGRLRKMLTYVTGQDETGANHKSILKDLSSYKDKETGETKSGYDRYDWLKGGRLGATYKRAKDKYPDAYKQVTQQEQNQIPF